MFYIKKLLTPKTKKSFFWFDDFSGGMQDKQDGDISARYAHTCFNVEGGFGVLKQGLGFDRPRLSTSDFIPSAKQIANFCMDGKQMLATVDIDDNLLVKVTDNDEDWQYIMTIKGKVRLLPYRQNQKSILLVFDDNGLCMWDGAEIKTIDESPVLSDVAICFGRVFGIDKTDMTKLRFCRHLNPEKWAYGFDKGGYIVLQDNFGQLQKVVSFSNKLFVFGDDKIACVTATASQPEFFVSRIFTLNTKIAKDTIQVCGDVVMFLAKDGLYRFDGNSTQKIAPNLDSFFSINNNETSCFFDGCYYLACKMNFADNKKICCENQKFFNNTVLKIDPRQNRVWVSRGVDISGFAPCDDKLFFVTENSLGQMSESGMFFGVPLQKEWQTEYGDLGINGKKVIKSVSIYSCTDISLQIYADDNLHVFEINGRKSVQKIRLGVVGEKIKICFVTNSPKPFIVKPVFEIEYTGG